MVANPKREWPTLWETTLAGETRAVFRPMDPVFREKRCVLKGVLLGQESRDFLLKHQQEIQAAPSARILVFLGTGWIEPDGEGVVAPALVRHNENDRWHEGLYWLDAPQFPGVFVAVVGGISPNPA